MKNKIVSQRFKLIICYLSAEQPHGCYWSIKIWPCEVKYNHVTQGDRNSPSAGADLGVGAEVPPPLFSLTEKRNNNLKANKANS